jgi:hypothetical protein
MDCSHKRFSYISPSLIDTKSNLSSIVLKDLCIICAVDFSYFEARANFIDRILLKRRNSIAHGEETYIGSDELDTLIAECIGLMRAFKDGLRNKVYRKAYLAA